MLQVPPKDRFTVWHGECYAGGKMCTPMFGNRLIKLLFSLPNSGYPYMLLGMCVSVMTICSDANKLVRHSVSVSTTVYMTKDFD